MPQMQQKKELGVCRAMQGNKKTKTRIYKNLTNEDTTEETKGGKPNECF